MGCVKRYTIHIVCQFASNFEQLRTDNASDVWFGDSGAFQHISRRREWFHDFIPSEHSEIISLGDNSSCDILETGPIFIEELVNERWIPGKIENVLHISLMKKKLFFVGACAKRNYKIIFEGQTVLISSLISRRNNI